MNKDGDHVVTLKLMFRILKASPNSLITVQVFPTEAHPHKNVDTMYIQLHSQPTQTNDCEI